MKPAATSPSPRLKPGSVVRCRTRRYLVEEVEPPMHRKVADGGDRVVTLACMEDDAIGQRLTVFLSSEIDFEVLGESSWEAVAQRGFDQPKQFAAYLNTLRWNCVTATNAELFKATYWAGIDAKAYQVEPLRKATSTSSSWWPKTTSFRFGLVRQAIPLSSDGDRSRSGERALHPWP